MTKTKDWFKRQNTKASPAATQSIELLHACAKRHIDLVARNFSSLPVTVRLLVAYLAQLPPP
jgi:hypothetical protein